jgi:hypothetical protein
MSGTAQHVWISDLTAGPLVLVREALLDFWGGERVSRGERSDCARARDVREIGCVDMKGGSALVLGDGAAPTTWLPRAQGGALVRWIDAESEAAAIAATGAGADATWTPTGCSFSSAGGAHVLFPAAAQGADTVGRARLVCVMPAGDYDILCADLEQSGACVRVYRLMWRPIARRR